MRLFPTASTFFALAMLLHVGQGIAASPTLSDWHGTYKYTSDEGATAAEGQEAMVAYELVIGKDSPSDCTLSMAGFQTDTHIICSLSADADRLEVRFKSYADGNIKNSYDVAVYPVDSVLFVLTHAGNSVKTEWRGETPEVHGETLKSGASGKYFEKKNS